MESIKKWLQEGSNVKTVLLVASVLVVIFALISGYHALLVPLAAWLFPRKKIDTQSIDQNAEKRREKINADFDDREDRLNQDIDDRKKREREAEKREDKKIEDDAKKLTPEELKKKVLDGIDDAGVEQ